NFLGQSGGRSARPNQRPGTGHRPLVTAHHPFRAMEPEELAAQKQHPLRRRSREASDAATGPADAWEPGPPDTPGPGPDGRYSLHRGSSFTFLTPGPHWDFTLKRKRREKEDDVVSLSSLDLKEPSNKSLPFSLGHILGKFNLSCKKWSSPHFGQTIQSFALRGDSRSPASAQKFSSRSTAPMPTKRRSSVLWSEKLDINMKEFLPMKSNLSITAEEELAHIFGDLDTYIPLHEELLTRRGQATKPSGTAEQIGHILVNWLPGLNAYEGYCSNQLAAKALLDQKKQDPRVQDFLQRCLESPFSQKLDLWRFLDIPRSHPVKYPLLLKEILKHTPKDHPDKLYQGVLSDINVKKGESEHQYYIDKLEYLDEKQKDPRIEASKALLCHGELKNKNGHKLYIFLFQDILFTSNRSQSRSWFWKTCRMEILNWVGGSFRGAFSKSDKAKNIFRVRFQEPSSGQAHTLQAKDVFHKHQWVSCIRAAVAPFQHVSSPAELQGLLELHEECDENSPSAGNVRAQRRASTAAMLKVKETFSECGSPVHTTDNIKSAKTHRTQPAFRKTRDKGPNSGKWKET
ncbi:LOW QUALITY PROTEIN: Neuroepithelial cell-transforming gene 1 protein, partial [Galemys pyrenaicus]